MQNIVTPVTSGGLPSLLDSILFLPTLKVGSGEADVQTRNAHCPTTVMSLHPVMWHTLVMSALLDYVSTYVQVRTYVMSL